MNMQNVAKLDIPEGDVRTIHDKDGDLLWGKVSYGVKYKGNTVQNGTPTPSAPVAVRTVTGENVVKICGKNLFDIDEYTNAILRGGGSAVSLTKTDGSTLRTTNLISQGNNFVMIPLPNTRALLGKQATVSFAAKVSGVNSAKAVFFWMSDTNYTAQLGDAVFVGSDGNYTLTTSIPSTIPSGSTRLGLAFYASGGGSNPPAVGSYVDWSNIQIELGSTATDYEPYQGQSYEVNLGKNLFDGSIYKENYVIASNGAENPSNGGVITTAIKVEPNTTYTASVNWDASAPDKYMRVGIYASDMTFISRPSSSVPGAPTTFTTPANARYVRLSYFAPATEAQLELGSQATSYAAYFDPIELCKIGTYQDYIYKSDGKWYVRKEVGKFAFPNTGWLLRTDSQVTDASVFRYSNYVAGEFVTGAQGISSHFIVRAASSGNVPNTVRLIDMDAYGYNVCVANAVAGITSSDSNYEKQNKFATWCDSNSPVCYYVKATPTDTEITNEALVAQLGAVEQWLTRYGYNAIVTGNLSIVIDRTAL